MSIRALRSVTGTDGTVYPDANELAILRDIHIAGGLPENCFPPILLDSGVMDPLFVVNEVLEKDGQIAMASFLQATLEVYLIVDHTVGTPEQRWEWLQQLTQHMQAEAWGKGFDSMTAWLPREIERSFEKRMEALGFVPSPWKSWTLKFKV